MPRMGVSWINRFSLWSLWPSQEECRAVAAPMIDDHHHVILILLGTVTGVTTDHRGVVTLGLLGVAIMDVTMVLLVVVTMDLLEA